MPNLPGTHPKPQGNIIIDGICGDQTIGFIEYFQEQMRLRVGVFEVDGQVAPQTPEAGANTIMRTLNAPVYYSLAEPRLLAQCIGFPPELMTSFFDY